MRDNFNLHDLGVPAMVARPVPKKEIEEDGEDGECKKAIKDEWVKLFDKNVFDLASVRSWKRAAQEARRNGHTEHMGRAFGIMVEKNYELPKGDSRRKYKYRVVFQGNNVHTAN